MLFFGTNPGSSLSLRNYSRRDVSANGGIIIVLPSLISSIPYAILFEGKGSNFIKQNFQTISN